MFLFVSSGKTQRFHFVPIETKSIPQQFDTWDCLGEIYVVVRLKNVFTTTSKDFLTQQNKTVETKGPWDIIIYFTLKIKQIKNNVQRQIGLVYILNLNIVKIFSILQSCCFCLSCMHYSHSVHTKIGRNYREICRLSVLSVCHNPQQCGGQLSM